jgi:hypothetical protein
MKSRLLANLLLLWLVTSIMVFTMHTQPANAANENVQLYINPQTTSKSPGDVNSPFDVYVDISNVTAFYGFDINITWNDTLITFENLDKTPLNTIWPGGYFEPLPVPGYQFGVGYARYVAVAEGGNGYTGSGSLFGLTFKIMKACNFPLSTLIHFENVTLSDSSWNSIPATLIDGQYSMSARALTLAVTNNGSGTVALNDTGPYYYFDEAVQLNATPAVGWLFDQWSGNLTGSTTSATLIVTGNMSVTATFAQIYTVTINIQGNGTVRFNDTGPYDYRDAVLLTAVPDSHWVFNYWSGNLAGSSGTATLVIIGNMSVTAWFSQSVYTLTVNLIGSGSVIRNNTGPYYYGDIVQVTANASVGYGFQSWSGDLTGSANPTTVQIDGNKIINAIFTLTQYVLSVSMVGSGSVTLNPNAPYYYGAQVQLTAVGSKGWSFDHWSGDLTGSSNPNSLKMYRNMSVTVTFVQINYTLAVHVIRLGSVSYNGTPPYHYGDVVFLIAVPNPGHSFDQWTGDLNSSVNPATLIMTNNMDVTAWFVQSVYTLTVNVVGTGNVTRNSTGLYNFGDAVLLTAISETPWLFDRWAGDLMGSTNPATLVITANMSVTAYFVAGPTLFMSPNNITCRVYNESFAVTVNVSDAVNVKDFAFEIHYNTTLLGYVNITWNAWGTGNITFDEGAGTITGSTSGNSLNGTQTLITIEFEAACYHIWKSDPHWTNDLTASILFQWANLSYLSGPDLTYERGGIHQINIGADFAYTFSPIQGDVNNDGTVDSFDLRSVAAYFGAKEGDQDWAQAKTYDLNGDGTIDTKDLDLVAANYWYTYTR